MICKFLFPLLGAALGIFLSSECFPGLSFPAISIGIGLLVWILITVLSKDPIRGLFFRHWHGVWISLLFMGIGAIDFQLRCSLGLGEEIEGRALLFKGEVKDIKYNSEGDLIRVNIIDISDLEGKQIGSRPFDMLIKTDGYQINTGDIISFEGKPIKILKDGINSFDGRLLHQGVFYRMNVRQSKIKFIGSSASPFHIIEELKDKLIIKIEKSSLHRDTSEFLISILLGDKIFLSSYTRLSLSSAGMAHVLALSGMHVAIMLSIFLALMFPLSVAGLNRWRKVIAILLLWIYVGFTGFSPSTIRAAIMASLVVGAFLLERKNSAINALMAAVLLILLVNPFYLWDIGLQLSFLGVLSILLFVKKLNLVDHRKHPRVYKLIEGCLITMVTTVFTCLLVAYYFKQVPLLFLTSNIILLPLLPAFIGGGLLYFILLEFGFDFRTLAHWLDIFQDCYIGSAEFLSMGDSSVLFLENIHWLSVVLWLIGMTAIGWSLYMKKRVHARIGYILSMVFITCSLLSLFLIESNKSRDSLTFKHSLTKIEVTYRCSDKFSSLEFPRQSISSMSVRNLHITSIDSTVKETIWGKIPLEEEILKFLIVGSDADFHQIAGIIERGLFSKVILHAGIGKNKKAELLGLVDESHWDKIYSLRENGSLDFDL